MSAERRPFPPCEGSRQRTQTSAHFPKNNNRRSHEPTTQPLPPMVAHRSLQQLRLPLRQQPLHKMAQRNISPRGKTGKKTNPKTTFVFPPPRHFIVMMEIRASVWDYFSPLTFSVMWPSAGQLQGCHEITVWWKATAENQHHPLLILWHTHFTLYLLQTNNVVASDPNSILVQTVFSPFILELQTSLDNLSGSLDLPCWEGIDLDVYPH